MYNLNNLRGEYIIVLLISTEISRIYCHNGQENSNSDVWKRGEANIDLKLNEMNSSYNTNDFGPEMFEALTDKEGSLNEEHNHVLNNYYKDFNPMSKRNAYSNYRMGKRKQLLRHKKPVDVNTLRSRLVRRKGKIGQSKLNLKNIEKDEYEGTSLYEINKRPFNENTKYDAKYGVDVGSKNSKTTQTSKELPPNKFLSFDTNEEIKTDKDSITNITDGTDGSYKNTDENLMRSPIITSLKANEDKNAQLGENEQTNKIYGAQKNVQETHQGKGKSENINEYIKKDHGSKIKRKNINKKTGTGKNTKGESTKHESKLDISCISNPKSNIQHSPKITNLSVKSGNKFELMKSNEEDTPLDNLSNKYNNKEESLTQKDKGSDHDEFDESKIIVLGSESKRSKPNEYTKEKGNVFECKQEFNEMPRNKGDVQSQTSNENSLKTKKEHINTPSIENTNLKISKKQAQNYNHRNNNAPNHNSLQKSNDYDSINNAKETNRLKKNSSQKRRDGPKSKFDREDNGNTNRQTHTDHSSLDKQESMNSLDHATQLSKDIANKRNQRDLNKRLRKHNHYKSHNVQEDNIFGYQKNNDEDQDLNVKEIQKDQDSYNAKDDDSQVYQPRKFDVNSNFNDKYSYKEPFEEEIGAMADEETTNNKIYNRKKAFSRQSQEPRKKSEIKEKCVEYKAEKFTKKTTCSTESTTEKCSTKVTTCATKRTTAKPKTTTQTCNKSLTTKNIASENKKHNSNSSEALFDVFDKFLCGRLADEFVDAVMDKVKRSRKIYKELGFHNDSEESCDRCIETKPNKMPDKEIMKASMGKCLKNKEHKSGCYMCYSVPKPMEKVLNLLVLFEKEHENSVYSKIRDDSSFIFTGDYPEQFNQNDNSVGSKNKYVGDRESFSKDTFDKQDLREDNNEDKHDDQVANRNDLENEDTTSESENTHIKSLTEVVDKENENTEKMSDNKLKVQNGIKSRHINSRNSGKHSMDLVEQEEDDDYNDEDLNVAPRSKYSSLKEPDIEKSYDSFDRATIKERRKALKSDKLVGPKNSYITPTDPKTEAASNMETQQSGERNLGFISVKPSKDRYDYANQPDLPKEHNEMGAFQSLRKHHNTANQFKESENNKLSHLSYLSNDKLSHKLNHLSYPSEDYIDEEKHPHCQNNGHSVANGFMRTGWDSDEYQLIPKQPNREAIEHVVNSVPRKRYYNNNYEERLNMVKRESEPSYEDEPLFFEIPNVEYDLY